MNREALESIRIQVYVLFPHSAVIWAWLGEWMGDICYMWMLLTADKHVSS